MGAGGTNLVGGGGGGTKPWKMSKGPEFFPAGFFCVRIGGKGGPSGFCKKKAPNFFVFFQGKGKKRFFLVFQYYPFGETLGPGGRV